MVSVSIALARIPHGKYPSELRAFLVGCKALLGRLLARIPDFEKVAIFDAPYPRYPIDSEIDRPFCQRPPGWIERLNCPGRGVVSPVDSECSIYAFWSLDGPVSVSRRNGSFCFRRLNMSTIHRMALESLDARFTPVA